MLRQALCVILLVAHASCQCPQKCRCEESVGDIIFDVHCDNSSLTELPSGDLQEVIFIDVSFNRIPTLKNNVFMDRKLTNLARLHLNSNGIRTIEEHAFSGLIYLRILNLADNDITNISSGTFQTNTELEALSFNGNQNLELPEAGFSLPNLDILSLKQCDLKHIPAKFFHSMPKLHYIFLRGNKLSTFGPQLLSPLTLLSQLDLRDNKFTALPLDLFQVLPDTLMINFAGNPIECVCEMFDTFVLYETRRFHESVSCFKPTNVSLRQFFLADCNETVGTSTYSTTLSATNPTTEDDGQASRTTTEEPSTDPAALSTTTETAFPLPIPSWNPWWITAGVALVVVTFIGVVWVIIRRRQLSRGYTTHRTFTVLHDDEEQNFIT